MSVDLSFDVAERRFNVRTSAIVRHEGYLLCDYDERLKLNYLPGGRIQHEETSPEALLREMAEELGVEVQQAGRPRIITESFYAVGGTDFHELTFYYFLPKPKDLLFTPNGTCRSFEEDGCRHEICWIEATKDALMAADVKPLQLHDMIISPPNELQHLVITS